MDEKRVIFMLVSPGGRAAADRWARTNNIDRKDVITLDQRSDILRGQSVHVIILGDLYDAVRYDWYSVGQIEQWQEMIFTVNQTVKPNSKLVSRVWER